MRKSPILNLLWFRYACLLEHAITWLVRFNSDMITVTSRHCLGTIMSWIICNLQMSCLAADEDVNHSLITRCPTGGNHIHRIKLIPIYIQPILNKQTVILNELQHYSLTDGTYSQLPPITGNISPFPDISHIMTQEDCLLLFEGSIWFLDKVVAIFFKT